MVQGPGKIEEYSISAKGVAALLYNFDIGIAALKPEHIEWLTNNVKPLASNPTFRTTVVGFASRSGSAGFNQSLSVLRAVTAEQVIWKMGGPRPGNSAYPDRLAFGEAAAALTGDLDEHENERWRSVFVLVSEQGKLPAPPEPTFEPPTLRRIMATFTSDVSTSGILTGGDGDRAAQNSQRLAAELWGNQTSTNWYYGLVHKRATLSAITWNRAKTNAGLSNVGVTGIADVSITEVQIIFLYSEGGPRHATFEGKSLSLPEIGEWLDNPSKKFLESHSPGLR